jgi:hypothetical protein
VGFVSPRVGALATVLVCACGTVNPGQDIQFAEITFDQSYFYCQVEPMLFAQGCGPGKPGTDPTSGCHFNVTTFRLTQHDPVPCMGSNPADVSVPEAARGNYQAAAREMSPDASRAPLLNRPTKQAAHPRQIFDTNSPQADVIRKWATKYTSQ